MIWGLILDFDGNCLSFFPCGRTRAVQKLLERLTNGHQISMVMKALSPGAVALTKSANGHHVIQYCLKNFSEKDNEVNIISVLSIQIAIASPILSCNRTKCHVDLLYVLFTAN